MALVKCKYCGHEISDKAHKCPNCGKYKNGKLLIIGCTIVSCILVICIGIGLLLVSKQNSHIKGQLEESNSSKTMKSAALASEGVGIINSDLSLKLSILKYNESVRQEVYSFYEAILTLQNDIHSGKSIYSSIQTFSKEAAKFDELEIDEQSEFGEYIYNMQYLSMYPYFKAQFIDNNTTDFDAVLVRSGYVIVIDTYLDEMIKHIPPHYDE
ncbi:zinc ribbon domain-containing protein [Butyrivibrio fibrisolvens]|uniref:zinc ribbon domain-containing protein n=1 Tax=Butyrivibrio fibrisolvens TaxID=831 RepID=UPI00040CF454|nr:zinc ribbon domain-containing protein [Butyrivibrio fibrisolvens]